MVSICLTLGQLIKIKQMILGSFTTNFQRVFPKKVAVLVTWGGFHEELKLVLSQVRTSCKMYNCGKFFLTVGVLQVFLIKFLK